MKTKNLTRNFVSRYGKMTYRFYMQQPRPIIETRMVKQVKDMSEEEKSINYKFLTYKHKLNVF